MAADALPVLPPELWLRVLQNLVEEDDLPHLWMNCRHVCTSFRDAAESIFRGRQFPLVKILFTIGEESIVVMGCLLMLKAGKDETFSETSEFSFAGLSDNEITATLRVEEDTPEELKPEIKESLRIHVDSTNIEIPHHTIQIRRDVHDGPIPAISVDYDKFEISFDWRGLFTAFYGEEQLYQKLTDKWASSQEAWKSRMAAKVTRGEIDMMQVITEASNAFAKGSEDCRKQARRARIRKQFRDLDGREFDFDLADSKAEHDALFKMKVQRDFASLYFTDEGEEGESDDEGEEDSEWEDEDEDSHSSTQ
jgi:hypothetical protein